MILHIDKYYNIQNIVLISYRHCIMTWYTIIIGLGVALMV